MFFPLFFFLTKLQRTTRHIESFPSRAVQLVSFLYLALPQTKWLCDALK